jgi:hypothetical protein
MCGTPAVTGSGAKFVMFAPSVRRLDALGCEVQRGRGRDTVHIEMPRCARCRSWVGNWVAVLATVTVAGGIAGTFLQSFVFSDIAAPSWLNVGQLGLGNIGSGIGLVVGFVAALSGMAWERKRSGRQSANTYPPVVNLRHIGWSSTSD